MAIAVGVRVVGGGGPATPLPVRRRARHVVGEVVEHIVVHIVDEAIPVLLHPLRIPLRIRIQVADEGRRAPAGTPLVL